MSQQQFSHEMSYLLWTLKEVCKYQPVVSLLNQMNPLQIVTPYNSKNHFNINFPSMLRSSIWSLLLGFLMILCEHLSHACMHHLAGQ